MNHMRILRRAFAITRDYRVLWVFGIILALTAGNVRGSANANGSSGGGGNGNGGGLFPYRGPNFQLPQIQPDWNSIVPILIGLVCLTLLIVVIFVVARYVAETALVRMVNRYEADGVRESLRQGFRLGWSRGAWKIFLVDLLVGLGGLVIFLALLALALSPLLLWVTQQEALGVIGTVAAVGLALVVILAAIVVSVVAGLLLEFVRRAILLEGRGVGDALRRGVGLVWRHPGDVILMGIILFGLGLLATILMIPVVILLVVAGAVIGGLPALLVGWLVSLVGEGALPYIAGALVGIPLFLLATVAPLAFIGGIIQVFGSSTWTLTYREIVALEG